MLDSHVVLSPGITRATWFKVAFVDQGYACKNPHTASLYPLPPGSTRRELYCGQCQARRCLFTSRPPIVAEEKARRERAGQEADGQHYQTRKLRLRARGLGATGQPLKEVCWNCSELRTKLGGYVCRFESEAGPSTMRPMISRSAEFCQSFSLRRVMEIPPLECDYEEISERPGVEPMPEC